MKRTYTEVREVLTRLLALGYIITKVDVSDDGEDDLSNVDGVITPQQAYDKINEYDEGYVFIYKDGGKQMFLHFVLGNEPGVALSNYTAHDDIDRVSDEVYVLYSGSENVVEELVDARDLIDRCKKKILAETECFYESSDLYEMVSVLITQRDNAYEIARMLNTRLPDDERVM